MEKIAKAKAALIIDQPFFASLLLAMPINEDSQIKTMATDGESIRYNKDFVESLSHSEILFVLAHEVLHAVFLHALRRNGRNANKWNIACDYVINDLLIAERIGSAPKGALINPSLVKQGNATADGVFALLPDETESQAPGQDGGALDELCDPKNQDGSELDQAQASQKETDMKVKLVQARNAAKMQGKLPGGIARLVSELTKTKTDWKSVLHNFINERARLDLSFAKPKRRFLADDLLLPSLQGEKLGEIVVAIDCSGSVNDDLLKVFQGEINSIMEIARPESLRIIYFDSEVLKTEVFSEAPVKLDAIGGGGTAFSPIFESINKLDSVPIACVILTDLESDDFGSAPDYPVLWASYGLTKGNPFGELVEVKL